MSIEELAFKDRKILANLNAIDLLDIIEFLQEDRNQWINQFTKTHNEGVEIQKENQELKSQLAGTTHCFDEEEHRKLKDEIKKLERIIELCHLDAKETLTTINYEQETQQKEFIEWLETMNRMYQNEYKDIDTAEHYNCVLQKYKEIIGGEE